MPKRAAICVGVNHAGSMPALHAAVKGAREFESWANKQGCDTDLIVDDDGQKVGLNDIYDAIKARTDTRSYEQLIVYFSGHGILGAPGSEYWLLSRAPENANEAVNLFRSIEDARQSGVPHIVFVSDACRSRAATPPLSGVLGGTVFGHTGHAGAASEVDVFYATRPGDPAWEVAQDEAAQSYSGIFTDHLLATVQGPPEALVEQIEAGGGRLEVLSSRKLKEHLEATVPVRAGERDVRIRQTPQLRVETALPKYFGAVEAATIQRSIGALPPRPTPPPALQTALRALESTHFDTAERASARDHALAVDLGLAAEVDRLAAAQDHGDLRFDTGFTLQGARPTDSAATTSAFTRWEADAPLVDPADRSAWNIRLNSRADPSRPASLVIAYESRDGRRAATVVAILHGFIGTVDIDDDGRVLNVSYAPAQNSWRHDEYQTNAVRIQHMRAYAAVAARNGSFVVKNESASSFASRIRQGKSLDPTLGLYAAYAYAQAGAYDDVRSVYRYMKDDPDIHVPFDVAMLASRYRTNEVHGETSRFSPFAPMLSQGWALLAEGDRMFRPVHARLRRHLVPSLWTTLDPEGAREALDYVRAGGDP